MDGGKLPKSKEVYTNETVLNMKQEAVKVVASIVANYQWYDTINNCKTVPAKKRWKDARELLSNVVGNGMGATLPDRCTPYWFYQFSSNCKLEIWRTQNGKVITEKVEGKILLQLLRAEIGNQLALF